MLPLWRASDDFQFTTLAHRRLGNVLLPEADPPDQSQPEDTPRLPEELHGRTLSDETKAEIDWLRSLSSRNHRRPSSDPEKVLPQVHPDRPLLPARLPPKQSIFDHILILRVFRWLFRIILRRAKPLGEDAARRRKKNREVVESNVPLEITLVLSR
jgi:ion channel-forming bestrophin family protein